MNGQGREQFRQIIETESESLGQMSSDGIIEPLQDLVGAISDTGVGAELVPGSGGRLTLVVWPRHRPAFRSLMLPFVHHHGEVIALLSGGRRSFQTADELRKFLIEFVGKPEFKASLAYQRDLAERPVEAVLRSEDHTLMIDMMAEDQERLDQQDEIELAVTIKEGLNIPATFAPKSLASAGLHFKVVSSEVRGREIWLRMTKLKTAT